MPEPDRWEPDPMLIDAALDGRLYAADMPEPDRAYVIAALTNRGESADKIADRLHCSLRLVKRVRSEPLTTTLCRHAVTERELRAALERAQRCAELRDLDHERAAAETDRLSTQIDDLVEQLRRTRGALDNERAERFRRAQVHVHVYRRQPTPRTIANTTDPLF